MIPHTITHLEIRRCVNFYNFSVLKLLHLSLRLVLLSLLLNG